MAWNWSPYTNDESRFRSFVTSCTVNTLKTKLCLAQPRRSKRVALYISSNSFSAARCIFMNEDRFFIIGGGLKTHSLFYHTHIGIGKSSGKCIYVRWCGARCFWSSARQRSEHTTWTHGRLPRRHRTRRARSAFISHQLGWLLTCVTGLCFSRAAAAAARRRNRAWVSSAFLLFWCAARHHSIYIRRSA